MFSLQAMITDGGISKTQLDEVTSQTEHCKVLKLCQVPINMGIFVVPYLQHYEEGTLFVGAPAKMDPAVFAVENHPVFELAGGNYLIGLGKCAALSVDDSSELGKKGESVAMAALHLTDDLKRAHLIVNAVPGNAGSNTDGPGGKRNILVYRLATMLTDDTSPPKGYVYGRIIYTQRELPEKYSMPATVRRKFVQVIFHLLERILEIDESEEGEDAVYGSKDALRQVIEPLAAEARKVSPEYKTLFDVFEYYATKSALDYQQAIGAAAAAQVGKKRKAATPGGAGMFEKKTVRK